MKLISINNGIIYEINRYNGDGSKCKECVLLDKCRMYDSYSRFIGIYGRYLDNSYKCINTIKLYTGFNGNPTGIYHNDIIVSRIITKRSLFINLYIFMN